MGNAVNLSFKQKLEERKKQAEKERQVFQACLAWNIVKEEIKKKEEIEKREKAWKKQQAERIHKDKLMMDKYLKNIERERKAEQEALKQRDEEINKKRKEKAMIDRRMKEMDQHIKREAKVMSKNFEDIEKRSIKSRDEMKTRVRTIAKKQQDDRNFFLHKQETIQQERKKEIEITKKRIQMIEKRIVQERVTWQERLMAARRLNTASRVSAKKLWDIGQKIVAKAKQTVDKKKDVEDKKIYKAQKKFEIEWKRKSPKAHYSAKTTGSKLKNVPAVKKTLSTVNEEESALLEIDKKKIIQRESVPVKQKDKTNMITPTVKMSKQERFQRLYMPKYPKNKEVDKPTTFSIIRNKISTNDSDSDASQRVVSQNTNRTFGNFDSKERNSNVRSNSSTPRTVKQIKKVQNSSRILESTKKRGATSHFEKKTERGNEIQLRIKRESDNRAILNKQNSQGILGNTKQLQTRKRIITTSDPILASKQRFKEPEVEKIMGINPLSFSLEKTRDKEINSEKKITSESLDKDKIAEKSNYETDPKPNGGNFRKDMTAGKKVEYQFAFSTAKATKTLIEEPETEFIKKTQSPKQREKEEKNENAILVQEGQSVYFKETKMDATEKILDKRSGIGTARDKILGRNGASLSLDKTKTSSHSNKIPNLQNNPKETKQVKISEDVLLVQKRAKEARSITTETKPKISVPLKARSNLYLRTNPAMILVDQRISEVQRRIDQMVKVNTNDIPVV